MNECPHGLFDVCCANYNRCALGAPKKGWVSLTSDEVQDMTHRKISPWIWLLLQAFETKLREKNT